MNGQFKQTILDKLKELPVCIPGSDDETLTVRCPYCGDSNNSSHGHFGIRIDINSNDFMVCHCLKCGAGGVLTDDVLEELGIYLDQKDTTSIRNYNKKASKLSTHRTVIRTESFQVPEFQCTELNREKLQYISNRLGHPFTIEEALHNKFILSIKEFMAANEIKELPFKREWQLDSLEAHYVGFLSTNNNCITFRCIHDNPKLRRYDKVFLNPLNSDCATFYSIPSQLNLFYQGNLDVHIAEGTFDILGVQYNVKPEYPNQVFYAACGYSYINIIKNLARHGIITGMNIHIYADRDKSDQDHMRLLRHSNVRPIIQHAYLHRNAYQDEKDYGVPSDHIIDSYRKLW